MITFNCTKAAADFFTSIRKGKKISPMSATPALAIADEAVLHDCHQWHWMIHVTKIGHKNALLAIDTDSCFCMLFWGLKKGGAQSFLEHFFARFSLHIAAVSEAGGLEEAVLEQGMKKFGERHNHQCKFVQRGHRSVQGHINDVFMGLPYEQYRWEDNVPTEEELFICDLRHNDAPRKRKQDKDYIFPAEELLRTWLSSYANLDTQAIESTILGYRHKTRELLMNSPFDLLDDIDLDEINFDEIIAEIANTFSISDNILSFNDHAKKKK